MRCLFCKCFSASSRSVEHIIPQSLGNLDHVLPPGVVCDGCNNYFAREVEKPFLECEEIISLRFQQGIPNKKGRVPPVTGIMSSRFPAIIRHHTNEGASFCLEIDSEAIKYLLNRDRGTLKFPVHSAPPRGRVASRFLAKVALEAMAHRLVKCPDSLEELVDHPRLDMLRNHARRGTMIDWPYGARRIYDANALSLDEQGMETQIVHEFDILHTDRGEWFFVLTVFGIEFSINYGGPGMGGYERWLKENDDLSPLYCGKNDDSFEPST